MANKIEEFLSDHFGTVRVIKIDKVFWFVAKDVADILEYATTQKVTDKVDDEDIIKIPRSNLPNLGNLNTKGGNHVTFINEGGLYQIVGTITKKDMARYNMSRDFKRWITNEVIPTLRETGAYIESNREQEVVDKYFSGLSDGLKLEVFKELSESNKNLQVKAEKFDQFLDIEHSYTFTEVAKMISTKATEINYDFSISASSLTKHLRDRGILSKVKSRGEYSNAPIKKYENYFDVVSISINSEKSKPQTRVKPNGAEFIYNMIKDNEFSLFI